MNTEPLPIDRLRYVTSRYPQLQGARLVPLSLVFLVSAFWRAGAIQLPGDRTPYGAEAWFFSGLGASIIASYVIRRWYMRSLGSVGQRATHSAAIPILGTCILTVLATLLQSRLHWHLSLPAVTVALVLFATGVAHHGYRAHYVAAAGVLFTFSILPLLSLGVMALNAALDGVIGISLLIAGLGDHRLLTRTLRPPQGRLA